ncbi:MAG TPA: hypothetical protein VID03_02885 [Acidimicrobiia bacterium]
MYAILGHDLPANGKRVIALHLIAIAAVFMSGSLAACAGLAGLGGRVLIHDYQLNGTYADSMGGPDLQPNGGHLQGFGYQFGAGEGLTLAESSIRPDSYMIEMRLRIDEPNLVGNGWLKLVDFKSLSIDSGFYIKGNTPSFYFVNGCGDLADVAQGCDPQAGVGRMELIGTPAQIVNDDPVTIMIERDGARSQVSLLVDGNRQRWRTDAMGLMGAAPAPRETEFFRDPLGEAMFEDPPVVQFLIDDMATGGGEAGAGMIDYIRVFAPVG